MSEKEVADLDLLLSEMNMDNLRDEIKALSSEDGAFQKALDILAKYTPTIDASGKSAADLKRILDGIAENLPLNITDERKDTERNNRMKTFTEMISEAIYNFDLWIGQSLESWGENRGQTYQQTVQQLTTPPMPEYLNAPGMDRAREIYQATRRQYYGQ